MIALQEYNSKFVRSKFVKKAIQRYTVEQVIEKLAKHGVEYAIEGEDRVRCACPLHGGSNVSSCSINVDMGVYHCFSNGCHETHGSRIDVLFAALESIPEVKKAPQLGIRKYKRQARLKEISLNLLEKAAWYPPTRGLPDTIECYEDVDNVYGEAGRVLFPMRDISGKMLCGVTGRSIDDAMMPKWKTRCIGNMPCIGYYPHLVEYSKEKTCYVVEGAIDAIKAELATGCPAFAVMKSQISYKHADTLAQHFHSFIILADNDCENITNNGVRGAKVSQSLLTGFGKSATIFVPAVSGFKSVDIGNFTIQEVREMLCR